MSDPTKPQFTVTIWGAQGSDRKLIAEVIQAALLREGFPVIPDPDHGPFTPEGAPRIINCGGEPVVQIVEVVA